jgi:enamine deaminase RidA (YjgF/YER057c/UK114 family)
MTWDIINPRGQPSGWNDGLLAPAGGRVLFVAGQTASDAAGKVHPADFVTQFRLALTNSLTVVQAAGGKPTDIGRMTVYVLDMEGYRKARRELAGVWKELMGKHYPAMALVQVSALLDQHALIEMETTAVVSHHQDRRLV